MVTSPSPRMSQDCPHRSRASSTLTDARLTDDGVGVRTHDDDVARREYETETKSSRDKGTTRTMRCDAHAFSLAEGNIILGCDQLSLSRDRRWDDGGDGCVDTCGGW